jgi:hypothetical protein
MNPQENITHPQEKFPPMKSFGLYTLGNDGVYDQLVALINSIERNVGAEIPICIIPFDHQIDRTRQLVASRPQVSLFENGAAIEYWERFALDVWAAHPQAERVRRSAARRPKWYQQAQLMRKLCAFDGEFERFVFYDADSLAMQPVDRVVKKLQTYDFVCDDWEHQKPTASASFKFDPIEQTLGLSETLIRPQIHCSSFFGSHRQCFNPEVVQALRHRLIHHNEANWMADHAFWCDADLFSYMTFRSAQAIYNFTLSLDGNDRTGNIAEMDYVNVDQVLFNAEGMKPIHRLHYNTHGAAKFARLCQGERVDLPYQDVFLFYRFLHEPELCPTSFQSPSWVTQQARSMSHKLKKLQQFVA